MVAYAEEDIIALPRESKELINSIEHVSEALLPGGHGSPIEVPNEASKEILNFLQS
ncbi:alpha/beta fold hydrolase [Candidiatus Paracoxiella cheracis]|uniref:alpha/beta fold hydrolase n=1 Tax=Candidiatus Paracoxiella cheracis TaxID=3405120 RepID=UPI003BF6095D